jgi:hypothetical protein
MNPRFRLFLKIREVREFSYLFICQFRHNLISLNFLFSVISTKVYRSEKIAQSHSPIAPVCTILCLYRHSRGSRKNTRARGPTVRRTRFVLPLFESKVYAKTRLVGRCTHGCRICCSRLRADARRWIFHSSTCGETHRTHDPRKVYVGQKRRRPRGFCETRLGALPMDGRGSWLTVHTIKSIFFDRSSARGSFG